MSRTTGEKNKGPIGLLYHPFMEDRAQKLAERISAELEAKGFKSWLCSAWEDDQARTLIRGSYLIISIGGDGTVLRVARAAAEYAIPILSINMGKLGFMTEVEAAEAIDKIDLFLLSEKTWKDERAMLKASINRKGVEQEEFHALNDVLIARGALPRVIQVKAKINGEDFTTFKGDGILISTATGSTGYALSLGGPILHPQSADMLMKAVSPHLSLSTAVIFPADTTITLEPSSDIQSILSIDGQIDRELKKGDQVVVRINRYKTYFLRLNPPFFFYKKLLGKLSLKE